MKVNVAGLILSIAGIVGGALLLWHSWSNWDYSEYEGEAVFYSAEEYTQFKYAILEPEVQKWEASTLTSDPPIVVQFKVETDFGYDFPFGERTDCRLLYTDAGLGYFIGGGFLVTLSAGLGLPAALRERR